MFCLKKGLEVKSKHTRDDMFDMIEAAEISTLEVYHEFRDELGVHFVDYAEKFNLTKNEYNKLKRLEFFVIERYYQTRAYGKYIEVPLLSAEQFFNVTREDIDKALNDKQQTLF